MTTPAMQPVPVFPTQENRPPSSPRTSTARATVMLVAATLCWGLSFPLAKSWLNAAAENHCPGGEVIASLTLLGLRTVLALLLLAVFCPRLVQAPSRREWGIGLVLGLTNGVGCAVQTWGLAQTSPALSVFFTSLASAWVPLLAFFCLRHAIVPVTILGLLLGIGGAAVMGIRTEAAWMLGIGEWLTLFSSVVFAVVILLLDRLGHNMTPGHLTVGFLAGMGLPALLATVLWAASTPAGAAWPAWTVSMLTDPLLLVYFLLLTVFPTLLAMHWMSTYQPHVPASRAALLYLLEPVFGAALSLAWGHDYVTARLLLGGGLILGGNFLAELPAWLRQWQLRRQDGGPHAIR